MNITPINPSESVYVSDGDKTYKFYLKEDNTQDVFQRANKDTTNNNASSEKKEKKGFISKIVSTLLKPFKISAKFDDVQYDNGTDNTSLPKKKYELCIEEFENEKQKKPFRFIEFDKDDEEKFDLLVPGKTIEEVDENRLDLLVPGKTIEEVDENNNNVKFINFENDNKIEHRTINTQPMAKKAKPARLGVRNSGFFLRMQSLTEPNIDTVSVVKSPNGTVSTLSTKDNGITLNNDGKSLFLGLTSNNNDEKVLTVAYLNDDRNIATGMNFNENSKLKSMGAIGAFEYNSIKTMMPLAIELGSQNENADFDFETAENIIKNIR